MALRDRAPEVDHEEVLKGAPAVVATAHADGTVTVVYAGGRIAKGTCLDVQAAKGWRGSTPAELIAGAGRKHDGKPLPRSREGETVLFTAGAVLEGRLLVKGVAGRVHDGVVGETRTAFCMAVPTRTSCSTRGLTQFMRIYDPASSRWCADEAELVAAAEEAFGRAWPGGQPGLVLRDQGRDVETVSAEAGSRGGYETARSLVARMVRTGLMADVTRLEVIPCWSLPMGREQVLREGLNPAATSAPKQVGRFGALYLRGKELVPAPTAVVLGDEEEWAHGGKTGRVHRVVLAAQHLGIGGAETVPNMSTRARPLVKGPAWEFKFVGDDAEAARLAAARVPAAPARTAAPASTTAPVGRVGAAPPSGRTGGLAGLARVTPGVGRPLQPGPSSRGPAAREAPRPAATAAAPVPRRAGGLASLARPRDDEDEAPRQAPPRQAERPTPTVAPATMPTRLPGRPVPTSRQASAPHPSTTSAPVQAPRPTRPEPVGPAPVPPGRMRLSPRPEPAREADGPGGPSM